MKRIISSYQFELSEEELITLCAALHVCIVECKKTHDSLQHEWENEESDVEKAHILAESYYAEKDRLRALLSLYNGLGDPIGKKWCMSI